MAAARAAARREALLKSGGNRLAKLTSSARGEDPGGVYANEDPPLPTIGGNKLENFVGEETAMPKPSASFSPSKPSLSTSSSNGQMPDWDSAQQQDFIRALMGGVPGQQGLGGQPFLKDNSPPDVGSAAPLAPEDPFSTLLATLGGSAGGPFTADPPPAPRPRTFAQKLIPVLHVFSMLAILVWFVGWREPKAFAEAWNIQTDNTGGNVPETKGIRQIYEGWTRWAMLSHGPVGAIVIPQVPAFFWAFITLQITLHSLRLVSQSNAYRPPMLLGLVMPYLPPPLPNAILTSLKYLQMGSMVLDDLAILVFGIGVIVFVSSNWMT